jgi:hypothetical protein
MTEKEYFNEKRVSSSSLKWFEISPLFFKKMLDKEIEQETKRYFEIGKKIHMKLLESDEFNKNYIFLDYETPKSENQRKFCEDYITFRGNKTEKLKYSYKNNYSAEKLQEEKLLEKAEELRKSLSKYIVYLKKRSEYKDILTYSDNKLINELEQCVKDHIAANKLLYITDEDKMNNIEEYNELVLFFKFLDIECKSMIDRLVIDHKNKIIKLIDIKTTSNLGEFEHSFEEFKYYRQMAFYWAAIHYFCKEKSINIDDFKKETYIIGLQKGDLPECRVFEISEKWLLKACNEFDILFPEIKWHYDNNLWDHTRSYYENNGIEEL